MSTWPNKQITVKVGPSIIAAMHCTGLLLSNFKISRNGSNEGGSYFTPEILFYRTNMLCINS